MLFPFESSKPVNLFPVVSSLPHDTSPLNSCSNSLKGSQPVNLFPAVFSSLPHDTNNFSLKKYFLPLAVIALSPLNLCSNSSKGSQPVIHFAYVPPFIDFVFEVYTKHRTFYFRNPY